MKPAGESTRQSLGALITALEKIGVLATRDGAGVIASLQDEERIISAAYVFVTPDGAYSWWRGRHGKHPTDDPSGAAKSILGYLEAHPDPQA
jgi:hypothetical protein